MNAKHLCNAALTAGVLAIMAAAAGCGSPGMVANPTYKDWAQFQPGSWVTLEGTRTTGSQPETIRVTQRLVEKTADRIVLERTVVAGAAGAATQPVVSTKVELRMIPPQDNPRTRHDAARKERPAEDVTVLGKVYPCRVLDIEAHPRYEGLFPTTEDFHERIWINPQIPGGAVKLVLDRKSSSHSLELSIQLIDSKSVPGSQP